MATSSTGTVTVSVTFAENNGETYPAITVAPSLKPANQVYGSGTAAGQITLPHMSIVVAGTAGTSIDLSGGALKDLQGNAATWTKVNTLIFINTGSNAVSIAGNFITGALCGTAGASIPLGPTIGANVGKFVYDNPAAPLTVTNATQDTITLTTAAGTSAVDIAIGGH